jgi:L-amino acid N-acyltransferase YncA
METIICNFESKHWEDVKKIYQQGILTKNATFETDVPPYEAWREKFHGHLLWIAEQKNTIVAWGGIQPTSSRKVYEGVGEVTIYVDLMCRGRGIGKLLMNHLISESEKAGIWTLYASVFPENKASVRLHESSGFREIGYREKIAQLDGQWRNTVLFERRSKITGI